MNHVVVFLFACALSLAELAVGEERTPFDWGSANASRHPYLGVLKAVSFSEEYEINGVKCFKMYIKPAVAELSMQDVRFKIARSVDDPGVPLEIRPLEEEKYALKAKEEGYVGYLDLPIDEKAYGGMFIISSQPKGSLDTQFYGGVKANPRADGGLQGAAEPAEGKEPKREHEGDEGLAVKLANALPAPEEGQFATPESVIRAFFKGLGELDEELIYRCFPVKERFKHSNYAADVSAKSFRKSIAALPGDRMSRLTYALNDVAYVVGDLRAKMILAKRPKAARAFPQFSDVRDEGGNIDQEKLTMLEKVLSARNLDGFKLKIGPPKALPLRMSESLPVVDAQHMVVEISYPEASPIMVEICVAKHGGSNGNYQIVFVRPKKDE